MTSDLLATTVQALEQHPESIRIKKLIFALCKKYWENNLTFINRFPLSELLQDLMESKLTVDELSAALNSLVNSLNRAQVYAPIAQVIFSKLVIIYVSNGENLSHHSFPLGDGEANSDNLQPQPVMERVVGALLRHPEELRIKKLLFAVYSNYWENNLSSMNREEFQDLILKIFQVYPTPQALQIALTKIVETINKPLLYRSISQIILNAFEPLYPQTPLKPSEEKLTLPKRNLQRSFETQMLPLPPSPFPTSHSRHSPPFSLPQQETIFIDRLEPAEILSSTQMPSKVGEHSGGIQTPSSPVYDRFEIRQMIMQRTNPLRAKILLFSVLIQPWDINNPDWSRLRSHTLDELIDQLILTGMKLSQMATQLESAARSLAETDDAMQAALTLIEVLKPFVSKSRMK